MSVKWIITLITSSVFFLSIPTHAEAQTVDFSPSAQVQVERCLDFDFNIFSSCGTSILGNDGYVDKVYKCLESVPNTDPLWSACSYTNPAGVRIPLNSPECVNKFAQTVCNSIEHDQFVTIYQEGVACSNWCSKYYIEPSEDRIGLKRMYAKKVGETNCESLFTGALGKISDGEYDDVIKRMCSNSRLGSKDKCIRDIYDTTRNEINAENGGICLDIEPSPALKSNIDSAIGTRFDEVITDVLSNDQISAYTTIRNAIANCQKDDAGNYLPYEQVTCVDYIPCVKKQFEDIPATDKIWQCGLVGAQGVEECSNRLINFIRQDYDSWLDSLNDSIKATQPNGEKVNCEASRDTTIKSLKDSIIIGAAPRFADLYKAKQAKRQDALQNGEDVEVVSGDLFAPVEGNTDVLSEAYDTFNCGFAGSNKDKCCTNTVADFVPIRDAAAESKCFLPNPFVPDGCFVDTTEITNPVMELVNNFSKSQIVNLTAFINANDGVPACFVGTQTTSDPTASNCTCKPPDGTEMCSRYIPRKESDGTQNQEAWPEYQPFSDCNRCLMQNSTRTAGEGLMMYTALGCIDTSIAGITGFIFGAGLGITGTVALFCVIFAALQMQLSQGNPEQLQKAQGLMTSCITGLIVVIFSTIILQIIGVEILRLPGWGP